MTLKVAEQFAGIGGIALGAQRAGLVTTFMGELLQNRRDLLARRFPGVPIGGNINETTAEQLGRIDVLCGGFPCTGTTIANVKRTGLENAESAFFWEFDRLLGDCVAYNGGPQWVVIENPDGLLKSPGKGKDGVDRTGWDLATIINRLRERGYMGAYRVLDSQYLGSPQRRRRVLLVCHRGLDTRPAWEVLADEGDGSPVPAPSGIGLGPRRGPDLVRIGAGTRERFVRIWRKSANPRAALSKGGYETWVPADFSNTLTGFDWGDALRQKHLVEDEGRLRTFDILEWERLAGFPDHWTEGMPLSDRAESLGASLHPGLAEWYWRRLLAVHTRMYQNATLEVVA